MCKPDSERGQLTLMPNRWLKNCFHFVLTKNVFDFWPSPAWSVTHHNIFNGVGVDMDVGLKISILRKSAFLSRHNSMGFICVCHFFFASFFLCGFSFSFFHFDSVSHQLPTPLSIVFYSRYPPALAVRVSSGSAYACVASFGPKITSFWIIMESTKWMFRPFIFITEFCSLHRIYYTELLFAILYFQWN